MSAGAGNWSFTGQQQEVNPTRQVHAEKTFEAAYEYAVKSETHLWIVTLAHHATDQTLDAFEGKGGLPILDADTLLMRPAMGCYVCESSYEPRLRRRRCTGEPRDGERRG